MKVICDRGALLEAVNIVGATASPRSPKPQLTCVKFSAKRSGKGGAGTVTLSATDGDVAIRMGSARVEVKEEGEVLIPADKFRAIVSAQDNEPTLTIEAEGDVCTIRGADAKFKVFGFNADEFPPMPEFPADSSGALTVSCEALAQLIGRTIFSTSKETSRYAINGVLLKRNGKKVEMVATDGRRLALARASLESAPAGNDSVSCIIPTKALNIVQRLLPQGEAAAPVKIALTDNQVIFLLPDGDGGGAGTLLASNLVEGTFPPYEDVIPKDQDKKATFDVEVLGSAVKRAALLTNEESRGIRLSFTGSADSKTRGLKISSRAAEMGEAEVECEMESYEGTEIEIAFNPLFITDALKIIDTEQVIMELKAPNKPGLIRSGPDFVYVVMPVNLQ
ncbi:MAG: DNA polymerase III subunit beta [Phycisphaerales bacterium]